jgi:hypothetical protein
MFLAKGKKVGRQQMVSTTVSGLALITLIIMAFFVLGEI